MRKLILTLSFAGLVALVPAASAAPLITLNESGLGTLDFQPGFFTTVGVLAPDPGPGGLASALTYNLLGPPSLIAGDLVLLDPNSAVSDVIRFNPAGTGGNGAYPASVVFYSLAPGLYLADTGFPSALYTNVVTRTETTLADGTTGFVYTPNSDQPGFVAGFAVTYTIISDVPEPASLSLVGLGAASLLVVLKRKTRRA